MQKSNHFLLSPLLSACLLLSFSSPALGQSQITDPGAKKLCEAVKDKQFPPQDLPTPDGKKSLANCSSQDLYFGLGGPADPVKARKCAFVEMDKGKDDLDIAGRAVLMMVYANGKGADRDTDLAIKLACEMPGSSGDATGTIYELQRFRNAPSGRFHICDHSAAPHLYKSCAILGDRFDRMERAKQIADITSQWSPKERKAFQSLQDAAERFFKSRASSEINLEPTFEVQENAHMETEFIEKLQKLQQGDLPKFTPADLHKAQAELDQDYAATQKDPNRRWGTATVEGVRKTQQLWIQYRDAWVKFGKVKYPQVSADGWKTWITQERLAMLGNLLT